MNKVDLERLLVKLEKLGHAADNLRMQTDRSLVEIEAVVQLVIQAVGELDSLNLKENI